MYNTDRRYHLLLGLPEAPGCTAEGTAPAAPPRRAPTLLAILKALSWIGEIRTMPFGGISAPYAERIKTAR